MEKTITIVSTEQEVGAIMSELDPNQEAQIIMPAEDAFSGGESVIREKGAAFLTEIDTAVNYHAKPKRREGKRVIIMIDDFEGLMKAVPIASKIQLISTMQMLAAAPSWDVYFVIYDAKGLGGSTIRDYLGAKLEKHLAQV